MLRSEALRFLGLEEGAGEEDIKVAYREMSQILHPDKFNNNEKLKDRATEQFKQLNDARDTLLNGKSGSSQGSARSGATSRGAASASGASYSSREAILNARLNGITAARIGLVSYLDTEEDSRRNGVVFIALSLLCLLGGRRFPALLALGSTGLIYGIVKISNSQMTIRMLKEKLSELEVEKNACIRELEKL
ncbi:MAG: J domain-containing protein [Actinobacteria bacterium]|nr:J domain-containing protein [Actinomycetota bacterium]